MKFNPSFTALTARAKLVHVKLQSESKNNVLLRKKACSPLNLIHDVSLKTRLFAAKSNVQ